MRGIVLLVSFTVALAGCESKKAPVKTRTQRKLRVKNPAALETTNFGKIKALLSLEPQAQARAYQLYPLVNSLCKDQKKRIEFVAHAATWVEIRVEPSDRSWAAKKAIDTIEHAATTCHRHAPQAAFEMLEAAKKALPDSYRFDVVAARLQAASGDLDKALAAALDARKGGSAHAVALAANIKAQLARKKAPGTSSSLFDEAIAIVAPEPDPGWPIIDITAILTTRAHLIAERAIWQDGDQAKASLQKADTTFARLSKEPYIEVTKRHALDVLCFDSPSLDVSGPRADACLKAAVEHQNLGAAFLAGVPVEAAPMDVERNKKILETAKAIDALSEGAAVLVIARGDESELVNWARPAAVVLRRFADRKVRFIIVDRTTSKRGGALLDRIVSLATDGKATPIRAHAGRDTFAVPCLAAVVAGRTTPKACPFEPELMESVRGIEPFGMTLLIGRDLDAEIDDMHLYKLDTVLLSFRKPAIDKPFRVQLKNLADTWMLSSGAKKLKASVAVKTPPASDAP